MLRYFRFFALSSFGGRRVRISYGFGSLDDAIRHVHKLDDHWRHEDPLAGNLFEFETVAEDDVVLEDESFDVECSLLCSRAEFNAFEAGISYAEAA